MEPEAKRNVTLTLPEPLLHDFKIFAAQQNLSMSALMQIALRDLLDSNGKRQAAQQRILERMQNAPDRGRKGGISWTRDDLHER